MTRGRPSTPPGAYGEVTVRQVSEDPPQFRASVIVRLQNGKRKRIRTVGKTAAEAKRKARTRAVDVSDSQSTDDLKPTSRLSELLKVWLDQHEGAERTIEVYESTVKIHINPVIGDLQINEITTPKADQFIRSIPSAPTAKRVRAIMSGAFGLATRYGLTQHNPIRDTSTVKVAAPKPRALTPAEIVTFRRMVSYYTTADLPGSRTRADALPNIVDFLLGTGVRISEALSVKWSDLDLDSVPATATITVSKDGGSQRVIQLPNVTVSAIQRQSHLRAVSEFVFPTSTGKPLSKSNIERWIRQARLAWSRRDEVEIQADEVEVSWVTPHSFRRTVATMLADQVSLLAASQQLGHSDSVVTEHHYLQRPTAGPAVAEVLNQAFDSFTAT